MFIMTGDWYRESQGNEKKGMEALKASGVQEI
jgi:hypothetical protein